VSGLSHQSARNGDGELIRLTAADLADKLASGEVSSGRIENGKSILHLFAVFD